MAEEKKYDSFGFPISNSNDSSSGSSDMKKYLKVFVWVMVVLFILTNILTGSLAGYMSFYEFNDDSMLVRLMKTGLAIMLSWFYLGWKAIQKMRIG